MNILNNIVAEMNKEELRFFKIFLSRTNENEERKDVLLFDFIKSSAAQYDEEKIFKKLYSDGNKNAFYRLKNRLINDISTSIFLQHFTENEDTYAMFLLSQAKYYYNKSQYSLTLYFLTKAEQKASKTDKPELLNLIYTELINLSHYISDINPEEYILKRKQLSEQTRKTNQTNDIVAIINYRLLHAPSFSLQNNSILSFLKHNFDEFCEDSQLKNSNYLKFKIYEIVPKILIEKQEYAALELYLLNTYLEFMEDNVFNQKNHNLKLQILSLYINVLYKNNKYERSLNYCQKLYAAMNEFNGMYFEKYVFDYYHALIDNYINIDSGKAIELLEKLKLNKQFKQISSSNLFIYLNIAIIYFTKQNYNKAIESINSLYMTADFDQTDAIIKFNIAITELIIRYELKDFDYIEHLIKQIENDYKVFLDKQENKQEKEFISIVSLMISKDNLDENKLFVKKIKNFVKASEKASYHELGLINYNCWLNEKYAV
ncbi:MAG: hypothetical protein AUJ97_05885 [Bacteroidetes bacterium CG2_30_32_10]|nr:MAG: hypothetical protein AUJ97_05885 [Bacteroidetes bacterium CG2_30_32_10]